MDTINIMDKFFLPYFEGETSLKESCDLVGKFMDKVILEHTFTCKICGKVILPKVFFVGKGLCVESDRAEIRGGLGNKALKKNICKECYKNLTLNN